jgi:hypothetical protein
MASRRSELLAYIEPYHVGTGRQPDSSGFDTLRALIRSLAEHNPNPEISAAFPQLAGLWRCLFSSSRFVLGLNKLRVAELSSVYQYVVIDPSGKTGYYFNIGEMSRSRNVCGACGEYAAMQPSDTEADRLQVQYQWFYAAFRVWSEYEGAKLLAARLGAGSVPNGIRVPFHKAGWQQNVYLDDEMRVVLGSEGGIFVLVRVR